MNPLLTIMRSQFLRLWRSKAPLLIALLGPLVVLLLAGVAFDTSGTYGLKVGTYIPEKGDLSSSVMQSLEQNKVLAQDFSSQDLCVAAVRSGTKHACLVFSTPFSSGSDNTITIIMDGSNLALASLLAESVYGTLENQSTAISANLVQQMITALETVRKNSGEGKSSLVKIATSTNNALSGAKSGQGGIDAIETLTISDIGLDEVNDVSLGVINATRKQVADNRISMLGVRDQLSNVSQKVNVSNMTSSERSDVNSRILNITKGLNAAIDEFASLNSSLNASYVTINVSLSNVALQLALVKTKVDAMVAAKTGVADNLGGIVTQLNQALVDVTGVQKSLDAIEAAVSTVTVTDASRVSQPIRSVVQPLPVQSRLSGIYPALLVLVVAFGALLLSPRLVHTERHAGGQVRMSLSPVPREMQALATILTGAALVAAQSLVLVLVSALIFGGSIAAPASTFVTLLLVGIMFIMIGNGVSYFFESEEAALLATLTLGTGFLVLSGIIIPVEFMPLALQKLVILNPVLFAASVIRQTVVFGTSIVDAAGIMSLLAGVILATLFAWAGLIFSRNSSVEALLERLQRK